MTQAIPKAYKGMGMEGFTAKWYANLTSKSMNEFNALPAASPMTARHGGRVLEVAPGPGYFAVELAKLPEHARLRCRYQPHSLRYCAPQR